MERPMAWVDANCLDSRDGGHLNITIQVKDLVQATRHGQSKEVPIPHPPKCYFVLIVPVPPTQPAISSSPTYAPCLQSRPVAHTESRDYRFPCNSLWSLQNTLLNCHHPW